MRDQDESDTSGSTAQFRAFVDGSRSVDESQPWTMSARNWAVLPEVSDSS